jgi:ABC-type phosphonate transport system ATPase subunit
MLDATSYAGSSRSGPLLSAVSLSKRYGDFLANDGIDLDLFPAEIHACSARTEPASRPS